MRVMLSAPDVGALEEEYVLGALRSGWVAPLGPEVDAFELEVSRRVGVAHAVALSSGTAALHLGLLGLGVRPGDAVITATMTFAATVNAIEYVRARPILVDSEPEGGTIDTALLERAVAEAHDRGERIGAIVPVDLLGKPVDYDTVLDLASRHNIPVLADAAEAFGSRYRGREVGSLGHASVLSFNGNKIMTTSGGGMLLTNDRDLADRTRYLATQARSPAEHYEHEEIGYNYRLSNILAALGRGQLTRLDDMIARRKSLRERYRELLAPVAGVRILGGDSDAEENAWLTAIIVDEQRAGWSARQLARALAGAGIESRPLWKPMHLQRVFADARAVVNGTAERLFESGLVLPSGSVISDADRATITSVVSAFLADPR